MNVIAHVAAAACGGRLLGDYAIAVTGPAWHLRMFVPQGKVSGVVVEYSLFPTVDAVAGIALLAIFAGVDIGSLMACDTGRLGKLVDLSCMTTAAGHLAVQPFKGKPGVGVVKLQALLPALRLMAGIALRAEGSPVKIVLFMTVDTKIAGLAILLFRFVTRGALLGQVFAFQWKPGVGVVKSIHLHVDDVGIAANVISMAGVAGLGAGQRIQAMEALLVLSVCPYFVVTVETEICQAGLVE